MTTDSSTEKRPFNLSRWAIGHPSIARFLFGLIILAGALGLMRMGQKEDPDFTFRVMVVQVVWPGSSVAVARWPANRDQAGLLLGLRAGRLRTPGAGRRSNHQSHVSAARSISARTLAERRRELG